MHLYGIPNCSTVKKARDWLAQHQLDVPFHDFKKEGVSEAQLRAWLKLVPQELLVNRKGTTWRALTDAEKEGAHKLEGAIALMLAKPSVIKRPVLEKDGKVYVGFVPELYAQYFDYPIGI